jgi:autotransporter-associated beta strand protein
VSAGTLKAGVASVANVSGAFGNNSAVSMANVAGATLDITGFNTQIGSLTGGGTTGGNVTLGAATLTVGGDNTSPAAYAGIISGTGGALTKIGTGTLTLSGANLHTGGTTISGGVLNVNSDSALGGSSGTITISNNATLQAGGTITAANRNLTVSTGGGQIDTNGNNIVVGGSINGSTAQALAKNGAGVLTFSGSGANTYNGTATVNAGTLLINTTLASATVSVENGGKLGGNGTVGAVTVKSGGILAPGNSSGIIHTADVNLQSGAHLEMELGKSTAGSGGGPGGTSG